MGITNPWKNSRIAPLLVLAIVISSALGAGVAGGWSAGIIAFCWIGLLPGLFGGTVAHYCRARLAGIFASAIACAFATSFIFAGFLVALANV